MGSEVFAENYFSKIDVVPSLLVAYHGNADVFDSDAINDPKSKQLTEAW